MACGRPRTPAIERGTSAPARGPVAVRSASPYRIPPPSPAPETGVRPARRARFTFSPGPWAASFAAHAALLGAVALTRIPLNPTLPVDPLESASDGDEPPAQPESRPPSFPLPHESSSFDMIGPLVPVPDDEDYTTSEGAECSAEPGGGWAYIAPTYFVPDDGEHATRLEARAAAVCATHAEQRGWSGRGRVFVRVDRRADGPAIATTTALDDETRDEALLCCLRQAQAPLVSVLEPGGTVRFVLNFTVDPAQRHITLAHTVASRRGGGPAALALVQSAFAE